MYSTFIQSLTKLESCTSAKNHPSYQPLSPISYLVHFTNISEPINKKIRTPQFYYNTFYHEIQHLKYLLSSNWVKTWRPSSNGCSISWILLSLMSSGTANPAFDVGWKGTDFFLWIFPNLSRSRCHFCISSLLQCSSPYFPETVSCDTSGSILVWKYLKETMTFLNHVIAV